MDRQQDRVFIGLPLISPKIFDHTGNSLRLFKLNKINLGDCAIHGIDSTELANECKTPLTIPPSAKVTLLIALNFEESLVTKDQVEQDHDIRKNIATAF